MMIDHDKVLPAIVMMSHTPCHAYIRRQYNGNNNAQSGAWYNSTKRTTLPWPGKSQRTHLSTVNVQNARSIDSAHLPNNLCHTIVHTIVRLSFTDVMIVWLAVLVLYHTLVDSTLGLSQILTY